MTGAILPHHNSARNSAQFSDAAYPSSSDSRYGRKVLDYGPGMSFGELALMYNTPRAASVVSTSPVTLWACARWRRVRFERWVRDRDLESRACGRFSRDCAVLAAVRIL